jgi:uncharacterized protein YbaR (Trm112 family)
LDDSVFFRDFSLRGIEMIRQDLLDILACPRCKEKVVLSEDEAWLICESCSVRYPIEDDIPIMLVDRSEPFNG